MRASITTTIQDTFHLAIGSIAGRRHVGSGNLLAGKNNQDTYSCSLVDECMLLGVFDGCGSVPYSEFGARVAAHLTPLAVSAALRQLGTAHIDCPEFWQLVASQMVERLGQLADFLNLREAKFIREHFLFTVLLTLISPTKTVVAGIGDGVFAINNEITPIGPFPDNAPDYVARALLNPDFPASFSLHQIIKTIDVDTLVLGTDGALDLIANANTPLPGKRRMVGTLSDIFAQAGLFGALQTLSSDSFESLTGWLRLVNSEVVCLGTADDGAPVLRRSEGLLPDDTTIIALRRTLS